MRYASQHIYLIIGFGIHFGILDSNLHSHLYFLDFDLGDLFSHNFYYVYLNPTTYHLYFLHHVMV